LIKFLEFQKIISIDWSALRTMTGISSANDINTLTNNGIVWIKKNIFLFGATLIGLLLGYRLG